MPRRLQISDSPCRLCRTRYIQKQKDVQIDIQVIMCISWVKVECRIVRRGKKMKINNVMCILL